MTAELPGLAVHGLTVRDARDRVLLDDVDLTVPPGGRLGVVGPSGAGKSLLVSALAGAPPAGVATTGRLTLGTAPPRTIELGRITPADRAGLAADLVVIHQDSLRGLNPCLTIGRQLTDTLRRHRPDLPRRRRADESLAWLSRVRMSDRERVAAAHPHQLSGGMRQRVVIALALCGGQTIIVADEPTTALDTVHQAECLALLDRLCSDGGRTLVLVGHDLALVAGLCDRIAVVDTGRIVEQGPTAGIVSSPSHQLTRDLVAETRRLRNAIDG
ncbi:MULTISPECIES: ATP-binding cassette domain-containing protein [Pseudonocardia]|uniref:Glutathione import ATP-binding protein GsiA n=2 Tax=Pseudonocardia TaxID=1847 RepID=A0A1Y2MHM6_PSEAH|nr:MULTISPECIES: ATP-binding cassette domain-containing protein [Pseudonocardia]OSY34469.1 Glutathione import ATP-binding protein GsiA [Pseudonocardia autotrophica]TDN72642.1 peptide/nickel transport system ATP-binding protein [Pseudonocardia autotrophica]BBG03354.1 ABC transporter ATP-binding protein [Pseudonocardia autotrophica]GEC29717.1 ABC transporter ATP-binding protein [Pseudonocardia saturnea]